MAYFAGTFCRRIASSRPHRASGIRLTNKVKPLQYFRVLKGTIVKKPLHQRINWPLILSVSVLSLAPLGAPSDRGLPPATYADTAPAATPDVLHYDAEIQPDIIAKTIKGQVRIEFLEGPLSSSGRMPNLSTANLEFDSGDLVIDAVQEAGRPLPFAVRDKRLIIDGSTVRLSSRRARPRTIEIQYHGAPKRGIRFFPERQQVYTVFATSQWMPCIDAPEDKASLRLRLSIPRGLTAVANGRLVRQHMGSQLVVYDWVQDRPMPTYIFGFAAGPFSKVIEKNGRKELQYLAETKPNSAHMRFTEDEVRRIFRGTIDMLNFYEDRGGVAYADDVYTQVLAAGGVEQEMSSFAVLRESYGREVLANERAVWLGAHELAHQWWGNQVTCRNWNQFWLNEGLATFMAAAYLEHRFGRSEYMKEIESYRANYEKVKAAGKDKSLVFPDWLHPTNDDRTLVYDKGAYALHLLREELGERPFWAGIRLYTRRYWGKSVTTEDFQHAMEDGSEKPLDEFFDKWIYLNKK